MEQLFGTNHYCCGCLTVFLSTFAIVFHSFLQGIFGICLVLTSSYRPKNEIINYTTLGGYICLALVGIPILWITFFEHVPSIRLSAVCLFLIAAYNLGTGIVYFVEYYNFKANALLDRLFYRKNGHAWVDASVFPFTFWHLLTGLLIILTPVWFYYAIVLCLLAKYMTRVEHPRLVEVVVLPNRFGPLGVVRKENHSNENGEETQKRTYYRYNVQKISAKHPGDALD